MTHLGLRSLVRAWCAMAILLAQGATAHAAAAASITVQADKPGAKIGPLFYGLMTEEINHSYDGGLYAELIQNRAFHGMKGDAIHYSLVESVAHWSLVKSGAASASMQLDASNPVNTTGLTTSLRLDADQASESSPVGVANDGYWGIPVWPHTKYRAAVWARAGQGFSGSLVLSIESNDGRTVFAQAEIPQVGATWKKYQVELTTGNVPVSTKNRFVVSMKSAGTVWLGFVSLFPPTYKMLRLVGCRGRIDNAMVTGFVRADYYVKVHAGAVGGPLRISQFCVDNEGADYVPLKAVVYAEPSLDGGKKGNSLHIAGTLYTGALIKSKAVVELAGPPGLAKGKPSARLLVDGIDLWFPKEKIDTVVLCTSPAWTGDLLAQSEWGDRVRSGLVQFTGSGRCGITTWQESDALPTQGAWAEGCNMIRVPQTQDPKTGAWIFKTYRCARSGTYGTKEEPQWQETKGGAR